MTRVFRDEVCDEKAKPAGARYSYTHDGHVVNRGDELLTIACWDWNMFPPSHHYMGPGRDDCGVYRSRSCEATA